MTYVKIDIYHNSGRHIIWDHITTEDTIDNYLQELWHRLNNKETEFVLIGQSLIRKSEVQSLGVELEKE